MTEPKLTSLQSRMFAAKTLMKLSFESIAEAIGCDEVYTASIFYGQAKPSEEVIIKLSEVLNIPTQHIMEDMGDHYYPNRGGLMSMPPSDPLLYRLFEMMLVYGYPLKAVITEKFGDGIMSAIDYKVHVDKIKSEKGDRVKITMDGKFLPYKEF
ncbi:cyanate hydratase [Pilobolus umbonatus]|nr:cyanate hydratase [Pilobolus umbonatus]